jgi:hypothetical protein
MFQEERMLKDKQLLSGTSMVEPTRDGRLSILTPIRDHKPRDSTRNSVSIVTDHSTWFQDFHSTELSKHMEPTTLLKTDGLREETTNNGHSTALIRQSDLTTGRTMLWKSNQTEDHPTLDALLPSTQDGGNSGDTKEDILSTRKERP